MVSYKRKKIDIVKVTYTRSINLLNSFKISKASL